MAKFFWLVCVWVFFSACAIAQKPFRVAHYNVENLFDTINDPQKDDEEFLPISESKWDTEKYLLKLKNLAQVLQAMQLPDVIGLVEVENDAVLLDLAKQKSIKKAKYKPIWIEGPDNRSIDVALLYKPKTFKPRTIHAYGINDVQNTNFKTRDILVVSGQVKKQTLHIIVNHWPSRRGGNESASKRFLAANVAKRAVDSILAIDSKASIVMVGDFNDEPKDSSVYHILGAQKMGSSALVNLMLQARFEKKGTHSYRNEWSMLDQIIVSDAMLQVNSPIFTSFEAAQIFTAPFMLETNPKYVGQPLRTFVGKKYLGGYSDHLPVFVDLKIR